MTGEPKPTLYHDSVDHLRRDLIAGYETHRAMADKYFAATIRTDIPPVRDAISDARDASAAAYNVSYTLAAVLGYAAREFGEDVAHKLACVADNVLANGDDGDVPHNADILPAPTRQTIVIQRACNGCGESLRDANEAELDAATMGAALPDVRSEGPVCAPTLAVRQSQTEATAGEGEPQ